MSSYLVAIVVSELKHTQPLLIQSTLNASQSIKVSEHSADIVVILYNNII